MKLRIQDNSIRFRLTRTEVEKLAAKGRASSSVQFAPGADGALKYSIETSLGGEIRARHTAREICVTLPHEVAEAWGTTDQVTIEHLQSVAPDMELRIIVEKDFHCAHRVAPTEENAADLHPNPAARAQSSH